jgi:Domain of unknown function (DUF4062)
MGALKGPQKAKVFISSLNTYKLQSGKTLSKVRRQLAKNIEARFPFLSIQINEDWPAMGASNPRQTTQHLSRQCHLFIGILVDDYGFVEKSGISATQVEFDAAAKDSREKMLIFMQNTLKNPKTIAKQPEAYQELISSLQDYRAGKIINWFSSEEELEKLILESIELFCASTLKEIRKFPAYASDKTRLETEWEMMTFTERHEAMMAAFRKEAEDIKLKNTSIIGLSFTSDEKQAHQYLLRFRSAGRAYKIPVLFSACPDRFSYADAARYVGYPFRSCVKDWTEAYGPLHVVAVAKSITDTQVRRHLGNPDIHVSNEGWGFFAADPERFIQVGYLTKCISPQLLITRVREFFTWLDIYEQVDQLIERAKVRGRILKVSPKPAMRGE